jgi:hypothetical protein
MTVSHILQRTSLCRPQACIKGRSPFKWWVGGSLLPFIFHTSLLPMPPSSSLAAPLVLARDFVRDFTRFPVPHNPPITATLERGLGSFTWAWKKVRDANRSLRQSRDLIRNLLKEKKEDILRINATNVALTRDIKDLREEVTRLEDEFSRMEELYFESEDNRSRDVAYAPAYVLHHVTPGGQSLYFIQRDTWSTVSDSGVGSSQ